MTKSKFAILIVAYFFVMNTIAMSLSYVGSNPDLQGSFDNPANSSGLIPGLDFARSLGNYFYQLMTFQIEGLNPAIVFMIFYIPILALVIMIAELIRGI